MMPGYLATIRLLKGIGWNVNTRHPESQVPNKAQAIDWDEEA